MRLRPIEVPVRPCREPREAKVFMAAPALDADDPTEKHDKKDIWVTTRVISSCSEHLI